MRIASVGRALPENCYTQEEIRAYLERMWRDDKAVLARLPALHRNVGVRTRHLALPLADYLELDSFRKSNDAWLRCALDLGEKAITEALQTVDLTPADVDALFSVSVTGIASPSLDARLINRMPLRSDLKRLPVFGLGCVAGAAGLARAADYVRAFPDQVAVLLSVELCSLTFQRDDRSMANLISVALFGDGAAAAVVVGEERARAMGIGGPAVLATRSVFYRDTEDVMGWDISEKGFRIVLSAGVPDVARTRLGPDVDRFLADHGMTRADIGSWVCHPGGPKVLTAMQEGLGLSDSAVQAAWEVLASQGNLSSASVLMALRETMDNQRPDPGEHGLLLAMGPGFCSEIVLLRW